MAGRNGGTAAGTVEECSISLENLGEMLATRIGLYKVGHVRWSYRNGSENKFGVDVRSLPVGGKIRFVNRERHS